MVSKLKVSKVQENYTGKEPLWDNFNENKRGSEVITAFNWYNYHFSYKEAHTMVGEYLLSKGSDYIAKVWKKTPSQVVPNAIGWLSRMILKGYPATKEEVEKIDSKIAMALKRNTVQVQSPEENAEEVAKKKANIQEIMREKAALLGGELEFLLDTYINNGIPSKHQISPINTIKLANILPQHVPDLIKHWEKTAKEFKEAYEGNDKDLNEAYSDYTKINLRNLIKFSNLVVSDLNSYVAFKKVTKAPRKRKIMTPAQQVRKLKYQRECKDLKIKSVKPEKIIGAKEMYVYAPKRRKLHRYVADEAAGNALMVKNNTIIGFDPNKTVMKTIRKPEQIKELMKASRPNTRKLFNNIKAVEAKLSGRFNAELVILKVF